MGKKTLIKIFALLDGLGGRRHCPLCGWSGFIFLPYGNEVTKKWDRKCPRCIGVERHRAAYLLLKDRLARGQRTLHVAPEVAIEPWLRRISSDYLSIDLERRAMRRMDLTALELPDRSRTLVWCSHVLEHIPDDRRAMSEIFRVLEPGGLAIIMVPVRGEHTLEDATVTTDAERLERFLQADHVRLYGLDITERLASAGFEVKVHRIDEMPADLIRRHKLDCKLMNECFVCRRPGG